MASLGGEQLISTNSQSDPAPIDRSREGSVERKDNEKQQQAIMECSKMTSSLHWFAQAGEDSNSNQARDREEKLRLAKERQNEERQKKIEELKAQAEAAQKYREQKEEERKRRIEEIRLRDTEKRQQVEERKKAIIEAEKERREYILRKNQEREARLEVKKRDRNSIGFAFGSSTPRLLEPADFGTVSPSIYWGHRRSTSITNVAYTGAPLSRRSSERELADGSKKRATSASGADRHDDHRRKSSSMYEVFNWGYSNDEPPKRFSLSIVGSEINIGEPPSTTKTTTQCSAPRRQYSKNIFKEDNVDSAHIAFRSVARRKTDLMPTIPSPRDTHYGSKSSLSTTPRTPGRAFSMNRLDQLAQPIRRNGEHIRAIVERERQHQLEMLMETESLDSSSMAASKRSRNHSNGGSRKNMSRSMTHLVSSGHSKLSLSKHIDSNGSTFRPLNEMECKVLNQITARRKTTQSSVSTGYRSGDVTPGGSNNTSRPGSAMSTSTNMSMSGYVHRRPATTPRKPRPASIAGTGVSLDEINKQREKHRTPVKNSTQTTPKRSSLMTTSTSSSRVSSVERKTPAKKDVAQNRVQTTPKSSLSKTSSSEKLKDKSKEMTQSLILENPKTKDEKNALNVVKTEEASEQQVVTIDSSPSDVDTETKSIGETVISNTIETELSEEKADQGNEKEIKKEGNNSKEGSVVREVQLLSEKDKQDSNINDMSASMIAKSKITTEEEAKAALAERRRVAREEAERQAELERQRLEAERLAEIKRQEEEAERERKFEEEAHRLAQEQRKAEEERLRQAIEEVSRREEEERLRREEEEKQRVEREEAEKKAKEEAEKQKIEVAERLKREEKEREERRKRVEAIMSRTRKAGSANTPNSTPVKESENSKAEKVVPPVQTPVTEVKSLIDDSIKSQTDVTATPITATSESKENVMASNDNTAATLEPQNSQAMYEQSVNDKESALMKSFSAMIIDENTKNLHNLQQNQLVDVTNGKIPEFPSSEDLLHNTVANGNGHLENINNKNEINILQDVSSTNQLIDLSIESQDINNAVNFNNNNSLLATTTTLVNADSHENKEISLL
ncbi:ensconsin isoform X2 [Eupeodes corollae]|uniref:ensconsin isoform X2 n=1 Tax=Eupeodes corollae TaxID=290404 RepID=UPI0024939F3E|nr:ensconsin isoform X2 [Eupeodes corollae]